MDTRKALAREKLSCILSVLRHVRDAQGGSSTNDADRFTCDVQVAGSEWNTYQYDFFANTTRRLRLCGILSYLARLMVTRRCALVGEEFRLSKVSYLETGVDLFDRVGGWQMQVIATSAVEIVHLAQEGMDEVRAILKTLE